MSAAPDSVDLWGYMDDGASEWGLHFPEANGDCQSPVNINSREAAFDDKLNHPELSTNYVICRECDLVNNGNAVQIMFRYKSAQGFDSAVNFGREGKAEPIPKSVISGGPLPKNCEFELSECRFHWGREDDRGSEHTVNFKAFPMELHLLHWNCSQYSSYEEALGKPDGVCIVALFIQVGREHQGLRAFTEHLEVVQYKGRTVTVTAAFNPNCLLPDPALRDFWTYNGSLTTPPCCEKATWILFRYPLTISHSQMEEFRRLRSHHKGETPARGDDGILADNFRPTQPLNDRIVRASFL
ncbi:carbonic anhydrase-related protein-like [Saccoglossus kowalevskii]